MKHLKISLLMGALLTLSSYSPCIYEYGTRVFTEMPLIYHILFYTLFFTIWWIYSLLMEKLEP